MTLDTPPEVSKLDKIVFRCFDQGVYWGKLAYSDNERPDQPDNPIDRTEAVAAIKSLLLELVGQSEPRIDDGTMRPSQYGDNKRRGRNQLRDELRKEIDAL